MFRDEVIDALDTFDEFNIDEETQKKIFYNGLYLNYTYGDPDPKHKNTYLTFIQVGTLLRFLKNNNLDFNLENLLIFTHRFEYPEIAKMVVAGRIKNKAKIKTIN